MKSWKLARICFTLLTLAVCTPRTQIAAVDQYYGMSTPNECGEFKVYGNYLYWQVSQDQMQYAAVLPGGLSSIINLFQNRSTTPTTVAISEFVEMAEQSFDFNSGFRVGLGYEVPCSNWDMDLSWTRFHKRQNSCVTDATFGVIPLEMPITSIFGFINLPSGGTFGFANRATSSWKFEYDVVDFEVGKRMRLMDCSTVRPFVGVKLASIKQHQSIGYFGFVDNFINKVPTALTVGNLKKNSFRGVGPSFGVDAAWEIIPDLNLTSGISGALLYGKFSVSQEPRLAEGLDSLTVTLRNNKKNRVVPTVNGNIGVDWDATFCDSFELQVGIGYEIQYWWNQWHIGSSSVGSIFTGGATAHGDLMIQGLTVQLGVGF